MRDRPAPLWRKVNTRTHGVRHDSGPEARWTRARDKRSDWRSTPMRQGAQRGLDYTPLWRFLTSRVGRPFGEIEAEARGRLPTPEPIGWLVAPDRAAARPVIRMGESSYWRGLYVDEAGILRVLAPELGPGSLPPTCPCCTHTLNGARFTRPFPGYDAGPGDEWAEVLGRYA